MCGILGLVSRRPGAHPARLEALRNRGPDNVGSHLDGAVGLYHTRLAVVDRTVMSNQPIVSRCGRYALVCNGEIYNHREIRAQSRHDFVSESDCEAILAVYLESGAEGFRRLRGMFSFGLFDREKNLVLVHRDPVGKKPMFYCQRAGEFLFASSVRAILDNLGEKPGLRREALEDFLRRGYVRPDISLYEGILPVLPGRLLRFDVSTGELAQRPVEPEPARYGDFRYDDRNVAAEAERLLGQSIERRARGIEKLVLLFSGGIDSTVLAKKLLESRAGGPLCITLRPWIPRTYDEPYARYAARKLGLRCEQVGLGRRQLFRNIQAAIALLDQPLALESYYLLTYLAREARRHGNVVFLGDGGDEVFYGYGGIRAWFEDGPGPDHIRVGPPLPAGISAWGRTQATSELLGHGFVKVDKATAEQQMEARCPYLDWDLMAFVRSIPPAYLLGTGTGKALLKRMLPEFPRWFLERRKIGFSYNLRYALLPDYRKIYDGIDWRGLAGLGLGVERAPFSVPAMFRGFDRFWKLHVLSRFLSGNGALR